MGQGSGVCRNKFHPWLPSVRHLPLWLTTSVPQTPYGYGLDPFQYPKVGDLSPQSTRARVTHRILQYVPARNFRRPGVHLHWRSSLGSWVLGRPSGCHALGSALANPERASAGAGADRTGSRPIRLCCVFSSSRGGDLGGTLPVLIYSCYCGTVNTTGW